MFLKNKENGDVVEVLDVAALIDPNSSKVAGRYHAGEEMQEPANFDKSQLEFPSGEALPKCWQDAAYRA
jgi:hypothetical protein